MAKASATKANRATERPAAGQAVVVDATKLKRTKVWGEIDKAVNWEGAFAVYGGNGTTASRDPPFDRAGDKAGRRLAFAAGLHAPPTTLRAGASAFALALLACAPGFAGDSAASTPQIA